MDIVIASHSKPRWSCHHCICPEKQLLHQKDWLHRDSGHFLWDFLRFFVWEIASSQAPNLFSITFSEKKKNPWKSSTWRWTDESDAILPQLLWQLGILTGMTPAGPNSIHLENGGNVWAETAGCTEIIWNLNLPWHFEFCTWSRCGLRSDLLLFRDAANQIHVGIVVDVLTTWAIFLNVLCAPAPFVSMFFQLLHFLREFINLNQRLQCYKMLL